MASPFAGLFGSASRLLFVPSLLSSLLPNFGSRETPIAPHNQLQVTHSWTQLDFNYPSNSARQEAIKFGEFIPDNNIPYGIDVWEDRIFVTIPKLRTGVPATLATIPRSSQTLSPKLDPYPNWDFHDSRNGCDSIVSVFRIHTDPCGRLWVLDSGKLDVAYNNTAACPPKLLIFDVVDNRLLRTYVFPSNQTLADNQLINIVVDFQGDCQNVFAYIADTSRYNLLVYSYKNRTSWRISHGSFYPDPLTFNYRLDDLKWYWNYGIHGLALGPNTTPNDRKLYYHAGSSYKEFAVPTSVLQNPNSIEENRDKFVLLGDRGHSYSHASGSAVSRSGVLFYGLPEHHIAGCWDTNSTSFSSMQQGIIGMDKKRLSFPNDIKVDHERNQSVWILNNNLHKYLFGKINAKSANYHILRGNTESAVRRTVCSPNFSLFQKYKATNTSVDYDTTTVRTVTEPADPRSEEPPRGTEITTENAVTTAGDRSGTTLLRNALSSQVEASTISPRREADSQVETGEMTTSTTKMLPATRSPDTSTTSQQQTTTSPDTTSTADQTTGTTMSGTGTTRQQTTSTAATTTTTTTVTTQAATTITTTTTEAATTVREPTSTTTETTTTSPPPSTTSAPITATNEPQNSELTSPSSTQRQTAVTQESPATQATSTTSTTTARSSMMENMERLVEDCKDLPIGPEGLRPCRLMDQSRNTVNRVLANTGLGDVLNNPDNTINNAVSSTLNNTMNAIVNNPLTNLVVDNPISKGLGRLFGRFGG